MLRISKNAKIIVAFWEKLTKLPKMLLLPSILFLLDLFYLPFLVSRWTWLLSIRGALFILKMPFLFSKYSFLWYLHFCIHPFCLRHLWNMVFECINGFYCLRKSFHLYFVREHKLVIWCQIVQLFGTTGWVRN